MRTALFLCALFFPAAAAAELYECNGTWTNKPCDSGAQRKIAGAEETETPEDPARSAKRSALHEVSMRAINAREEFEVRVDLVPAQNVCLKPIYTLAQCQTAVRYLDEELDNKIALASKIAADRKTVELQEEANRLQRERNEIEANKPNVTVVEERIYVVPRPRHHGYPHSQQSVGGTIQIQGNSASGNVSGSVTVGGSSTTGAGYPHYGGAGQDSWKRSGGSGMITDRPNKRRFEKPLR